MAKIILHPSILSIHGRIGDIIFYNVCGFQYARSYTIPRNPRTEAQQNNRATFADAVKLWQGLSKKDKSIYNRMAADKPVNGYNLFISMTMQGMTALSLLRGKGKGFSIVPSYILRITSVPVPLGPVFTRYNTSAGLRVLKKPPGITSIAA